MSAAVQCPDCSHEFFFPATWAGSVVACPRCRKPVAPAQTTSGGAPDQGTLDRSTPPRPPPGASIFAAPPSAVGPGVVIDGRYEVAEELGRGAFGVVYRAVDIRLARKSVAIKVLLEQALATPDAVRRFRAEGDVLCKVQHAHVPAVLDIGEVAGQQYIAFAFVKGKTVRELIPPGGMDPAAAVRLATKLVRTLHDIYSQWSILHRDVKPANMMVPDGQADGLYLMDFGLAVCHDTDQTRTRDGSVLGTPAYMAPEQATGQISATGHPADLYAAAAVLYHLLTGRPPFNSPWPQILFDIKDELPDQPSWHRPELDTELDDIVMKGLSKDPRDRYATGDEFAKQLELWSARALVSGSGAGAKGPATPHPLPPKPPTVAPGAQPRSVSGVRPPAPRPKFGEAQSPATNSAVNAPRPTAKPVAPRPKPAPAPPVLVVKALPTRPAPPPLPVHSYRPLFLKLLAVVAAVLLLAVGSYALYRVVSTKPGSGSSPTKSGESDGPKKWDLNLPEKPDPKDPKSGKGVK